MNGEIKLFGMLAEMGLTDGQIKAILDTLRKHRVAFAAEHIVAVRAEIAPEGYANAYIYLNGGWEIMVYPRLDKVKIEHAQW